MVARSWIEPFSLHRARPGYHRTYRIAQSWDPTRHDSSIHPILSPAERHTRTERISSTIPYPDPGAIPHHPGLLAGRWADGIWQPA